jgi:hypothetical protein
MRDWVTHACAGARDGSQFGDLVSRAPGVGFSRSDRSARVASAVIA